MSETPPPPPAGGDQPPPTTPYPQQPPPPTPPTPQGWQPGWQPSWQPTTGDPAAGQQPYGQPPGPQVPYGSPQYTGMFGPVAPDHPQATTVLILGILGLVLCQFISPFAWVMGNRVIREIDASGGTIGGRSNANAGRICGIVGTILIGVGLAITVAVVILAIAGTATSA
jgi:hypothetical protein